MCLLVGANFFEGRSKITVERIKCLAAGKFCQFLHLLDIGFTIQDDEDRNLLLLRRKLLIVVFKLGERTPARDFPVCHKDHGSNITVGGVYLVERIDNSLERGGIAISHEAVNTVSELLGRRRIVLVYTCARGLLWLGRIRDELNLFTVSEGYLTFTIWGAVSGAVDKRRVR